MSARVIDFLRLRRGIADTLTELLGGAGVAPLVHWLGQRQPAPAPRPYVGLALRAFRPATHLEELKVSTTASSTISMPGAPTVGTWLRLQLGADSAEYQVPALWDPVAARDALLSQVEGFAPVLTGGAYSAGAGGISDLLLAALQLGGLPTPEVQGGLVAVDVAGDDALRAVAPATFVLEVEVYGRATTSSADQSAVGADHPDSIGQTIAFKLQRRRWAAELRARADVSLWQDFAPTSRVPAGLGAGVEPRSRFSVGGAVTALDFDSVPPALTSIRGTVTTKDTTLSPSVDTTANFVAE